QNAIHTSAYSGPPAHAINTASIPKPIISGKPIFMADTSNIDQFDISPEATGIGGGTSAGGSSASQVAMQATVIPHPHTGHFDCRPACSVPYMNIFLHDPHEYLIQPGPATSGFGACWQGFGSSRGASSVRRCAGARVTGGRAGSLS